MMKHVVLSAILSVFSISAFAQMGPSNGGGGDVVILPDDSVVLADPFLNNGAPQPDNMPPLRSINPRILKAVMQYEKAAGPLVLRLAGSDKSDIDNQMTMIFQKTDSLKFYGVQSSQELANFCAPGGKKNYQLPDGASVQSVACTAGAETYIVEPLFKQLTIRDQALLLVHERLTTLRDKNGGKNYSAVARFTTGLGAFLKVYQEQVSGVFRVLSQQEVDRLTDFYVAIEELEKRNGDINDESFMWKAHSYGGGMILASTHVGENTLIDLRSRVDVSASIGANVRIINASVMKEVEIGDNSSVVGVYIGSGSKIGRSNSIKNLKGGFGGTTGANVRIENSSFRGYLRIGSNVTITDSSVYAPPSMNIASDQTLNKILIPEGSEYFAPQGYKVKVINTDTVVKCSPYEEWGDEMGPRTSDFMTITPVGKKKLSDWMDPDSLSRYKITGQKVVLRISNNYASAGQYGISASGMVYPLGVRYRMSLEGMNMLPEVGVYLTSLGIKIVGTGRDSYMELPLIK